MVFRIQRDKAYLSRLSRRSSNKENIHPLNRDLVVILFAWNEWAEGAILEESVEFGASFLEQLHNKSQNLVNGVGTFFCVRAGQSSARLSDMM